MSTVAPPMSSGALVGEHVARAIDVALGYWPFLNSFATLLPSSRMFVR